MRGDGKTSVEYDPTTGVFTIQPDGNPVGLFDIQSVSGIFSGSATFPPGGIIAVNSANQKSWLGSTGSAFTQNYLLGTITIPGLPLDFLLNDLSLVGSGGLGTPNVNFDLVYTPIDHGDAPDAAPGTGRGNYNTRVGDNGPRHTIVPGLRLGTNIDGDSGSLQNAGANADDVNGALPDDEDAIINPLAHLVFTVGTRPVISLRATNTTGSPAVINGWIDYNADGVFDNVTERDGILVLHGETNSRTGMVFPTVPGGFTGTTYARIRISTDSNAISTATGPAPDGEVEDYRVTINRPSVGTADGNKTVKVASGTGGGPTLANGDMFGSAVAALGDLDGDGFEDMAVGAPSQTGSGSAGAVFVQFMNANGTVRASQRIAGGVGGGPPLTAGDYFGHAVTAIGDLDGDGILDLAVGADKDDTSGYNRGAVYVLFLNANGTVKRSQKITHNFAGGPTLANNDRFGSAIASLGDLDGDGITDLAVGAAGDDTGGDYRGAVHVLFLNTNGTVKSSQKIASGVGGGPTLANGDVFGISAAAMDSPNRPGVLAVGALFDDTGGTGRGAVHVLFLNPDGTVSTSQKIASGIGGAPPLADGDYFGRSLAALSDLDGDGVFDLAVGAYRDDTGGSGRGAVHLLFMNDNGTVKQSTKIANGTGGGPTLTNDSRFGSAIAALGDLDGDGVIDLAAGAETDNTGGAARGAVFTLFLRPGNSSPVFTSPATASVPENSTIVMTVTATDVEAPPQTINFSLVGGPDQARFAITSGGLLTFSSPPNFEAPTDANNDNLYVVTVQASDGSGGIATQTINVAVTPVNDNGPVIISADAVNVAENTTRVRNVIAFDADLPPQVLVFSIVGGADQSKFNIAPGGTLSFNTPPDFESPTDVNGDNTYVVIVQASDGTFTSLQAILVTVTDVVEQLVGDYNRNGTVDAADYVVWRNTLGSALPPFSGADGNGDGLVSASDYNVWRANFGRTAGAASSASAGGATSLAQSSQPREAASLGHSVAEAALPVAGLPSLPTNAASQSASPRARAHRPAQRDGFVSTAARDHALVAWLASRSVGMGQRPSFVDFADSPNGIAAGDEREPSLESLDLAFVAV
jgi:hypothetical protein